MLATATVLKLVSALAKGLIVDSGGSKALSEIVKTAVDMGADAMPKARGEDSDAQRLEIIAKATCADVLAMLTNENLELLPAEQNQVATAVALALARSNIRAETVLACRFEPSRIRAHIMTQLVRPPLIFTGQMDQAADRIVDEISHRIIRISRQLYDYEVLESKLSISIQDKIFAALESQATAADLQASEYETAYLSALRVQLDRTDYSGEISLDERNRSRSLAATFVPLGISKRSSHGLAMYGQTTYDDVTEGPPNKNSGDQVQEHKLVRELIEDRRLVIVGNAGSGKTTLLRWLATRLAKRPIVDRSEPPIIPFVLPMRAVHDLEMPQIENFDSMTLILAPGNKPKGWVADQLVTGKALVMLDGVDELPSGSREAFLEWLGSLMSMYPCARYIVTSRPTVLSFAPGRYLEASHSYETFEAVRLLPMQTDEMIAVVSKWYLETVESSKSAIDKAELTASMGRAVRLLLKSPELRRLSDSPLLCTLFCTMHMALGDALPSERASLYKTCCEVLVSDRDLKRRIPIGPEYADLDKEQRLAALRALALWMQRNGALEEERDRVDAFLSSFASWLRQDKPSTGESMRRLFTDRTGMLIEVKAGSIMFAHRTLQEFLAAQELVRDQSVGELLERADKQDWREVTVFSAGAFGRRDLSELIKGLMSRGRAMLALACIGARTDVDPEIVRDVRQAVDSLLAALPEEDLRWADVASAGPISVAVLMDYIRPRFSDRNTEAVLDAIRSLARIGTTGALEALGELAIVAQAFDSPTDATSVICDGWDFFDRLAYARTVLRFVRHVTVSSLPDWSGVEYLDRLISLEVAKVSMTPDEFARGVALLPSLEAIGIPMQPELISSLKGFVNLKSLTLKRSYNQGSPLSPEKYAAALGQLSSVESVTVDPGAHGGDELDLIILRDMVGLATVFVPNSDRLVSGLVHLLNNPRLTEICIETPDSGGAVPFVCSGDIFLWVTERPGILMVSREGVKRSLSDLIVYDSQTSTEAITDLPNPSFWQQYSVPNETGLWRISRPSTDRESWVNGRALRHLMFLTNRSRFVD